MSQTPQQAERFSPEAPPGSSTPLWRNRWFWRLALFLGAAGLTALLVTSQWHPFWMAKYRQRIKTLRDNDALNEAAAECDKAIAAYPGVPDFYYERGRVWREQEKYAEALADLDKVLTMNRTFGDGYIERGRVHARRRDYPRALADLAEARKWHSETDYDLLNEHAYIRALAKTELPEGLVDIEKALALLAQDIAKIERGSAKAVLAAHVQATYLDTRGYILHLLEQDAQALLDLDQAIAQEEEFYAHRVQAYSAGAEPPPRWLRQKELIEEGLGTLYHHRGLVHEKLGNVEKTKADFKRRDELGFDPAKE